LIKEKEIEDVFYKFDQDRSGTIELRELYEMFLYYGVDINQYDLRKLFKIVDIDGSGALSIAEFKNFSSNPLANSQFRKMVQRIRSEH
jgi:Ca2+-binding EF-hand superfamily protein